jgi:hypothetical protein
MDRLLNVLAVLSFLLLLAVLRAVRREHIRVEYSVAWLAAAVVLLALSRAPGLLGRVSGWVGVAESSVVLLYLVLVVFLGVFFRFSTLLSSLKDANIALTQRVAILEFQLRSIHEEAQTPHSS